MIPTIILTVLGYLAQGVVLILAFVVVVSALASLAALAIGALPVAKVPFRYNLRNVQVRWKTSLVTGLAFTLVMFLVVFMLAWVKGLNKLTETSGHPGNVIVLADGATDEAWSNLPDASIELLPSDVQAYVARDENGKALFSKEVYVIANQELPAADGKRKRRFVQMRGLSDMPMAARIHEIELASGNWPSAAGSREVTLERNGSTVKDTVSEIVLGDGVAKTLGGDAGKEALVPGDLVDIGNYKWYVTGVLKATGSSFGSEVWTRDTYLGERFGKGKNYSSFLARTRDPNQVASDAEIAKVAAKALKDYKGERTFNAQTEMEYYSKLQGTNMQFRYAFLVITVFMAIGGALGVMNTMFAAISQRGKDIGVLRLLGYSRLQVLSSFLLESLLIAFMGGAVGIGLGLLCDGWSFTSIISSGQGGGKTVVFRLVVDGSVLATAALFTFLMGAVGGFIPSVSAMRLKPLESLR